MAAGRNAAGTPARKSRGVLRERARTDHSLRTERKKSDDALKRDRTAAEAGADQVVARARSVADALAALLVHERAATDGYLLTERARSDDAIANRDDFLGLVAHDVRNLLNLVALSLEQLRPGDDEPPPHVSAVADRIRRYVARMNRLIGDLLDVTSIEAGRLAVAPREGDAAALVTEVTETFQVAAREKGLTLAAELPGHPLPAEFDHERMLQVFVNLVANAIKFTPSGGRITLRVEEARGALRFCVMDTGPGIPPGTEEAVFERFWQVGQDHRRGRGLGLYISRSLVEAHHGRIWVESTPGTGSRFYLTLPLPGSRRRGSEPRAAARDAARPPRRGKARAERRRR